jgi:hypothetical protein
MLIIFRVYFREEINYEISSSPFLFLSVSVTVSSDCEEILLHMRIFEKTRLCRLIRVKTTHPALIILSTKVNSCTHVHYKAKKGANL